MNFFSSISTRTVKRLQTVEDAAHWLSDGNLLIYPTETFFALGCPVSNSEGMEAIYSIKGRDHRKPLPVLGSSISNLEKIVRLDLVAKRLGEIFWPGPLSILCQALASASLQLQNANGEISVRVSSNAQARKLCEALASPIAATSANLSGKPPAMREWEFTEDFIASANASAIKVGFAGWSSVNRERLPSTIIAPKENGKIRLLRAGQISANSIVSAGFEVEPMPDGQPMMQEKN